MMRTFLDEGAITFEGDFFQYTGLFTFARPVQERIPLQDGRDEGPALVPGRGRARRRHAPRARLHPRGLRLHGRERADRRREGRARLDDLDIGAWVVTVVGEDSRRGQAGRPDPRRASTSPRCPPSSSRATASTPESSRRSSTRSARATSPGIELPSSPDLAERLSVAGTPEECVEKLKPRSSRRRQPHDPRALRRALVKAFMGREVEGVPDVDAQLRLVPDRVMPAFA